MVGSLPGLVADLLSMAIGATMLLRGSARPRASSGRSVSQMQKPALN